MHTYAIELDVYRRVPWLVAACSLTSWLGGAFLLGGALLPLVAPAVLSCLWGAGAGSASLVLAVVLGIVGGLALYLSTVGLLAGVRMSLERRLVQTRRIEIGLLEIRLDGRAVEVREIQQEGRCLLLIGNQTLCLELARPLPREGLAALSRAIEAVQRSRERRRGRAPAELEALITKARAESSVPVHDASPRA